jgi:dihydroxyacetone kinase
LLRVALACCFIHRPSSDFMKRAGEAVLALPATAWPSAADALAELAVTLRRAIAGSSGPFYATALLRASRRLAQSETPTASDWADAFDLAVSAISELGGAKPGERTMLDALRPAADAFSAAVQATRRSTPCGPPRSMPRSRARTRRHR